MAGVDEQWSFHGVRWFLLVMIEDDGADAGAGIFDLALLDRGGGRRRGWSRRVAGYNGAEGGNGE